MNIVEDKLMEDCLEKIFFADTLGKEYLGEYVPVLNGNEEMTQNHNVEKSYNST